MLGCELRIKSLRKQRMEDAGAPPEDPPEKTEADEDEGEWVRLEMKLIDWSYMDFARVVRVDTSVHTIKEVIAKWHGGNIAKLTVCKGSFKESNEMRNDNATLKECGIDGTPDKSEAPSVCLHYNFTPGGCDEPDPILMC